MPANPPKHPTTKPPPETLTVGVLSDTHGYLNPAALQALAGVDLIIHAGDSEGPEILKQLARIAPIYPVRGNMDIGVWSENLPREDIIAAGALTILALHDLARLSLDPAACGVRAVVSGHTHRPEAAWRKGLLFLNPGSVSFPRAGYAPSLALLSIQDKRLAYRFLFLAER